MTQTELSDQLLKTWSETRTFEIIGLTSAFILSMRREYIGRVFQLRKQRELEFPVKPVWLRYLNSETTMIFGEIFVRRNQTVLRISLLRCQIDFFTKTAAKRLATREK